MTFTCRNRKYGFERTGSIVLLWEIEGDPISDGYSPDDIDAAELWTHWRRTVPGSVVPIHWYVEGPGLGTFEFAPFQGVDPDLGDFLTHFTWPVDDGGEPIRWTNLPVADKLWRPGTAHKGGFIQELTGWKPSPLQELMDVARIERAIGWGGCYG